MINYNDDCGEWCDWEWPHVIVLSICIQNILPKYAQWEQKYNQRMEYSNHDPVQESLIIKYHRSLAHIIQLGHIFFGAFPIKGRVNILIKDSFCKKREGSKK